MLETEDKLLKATQASVDQINNKYQMSQDEIKALKNRFKGNMSLIEARKLIWDIVIFEIKKIWENLRLVAKQKVAVKTTEFSILSAKEENAKNANNVEKFIKLINEKSLDELRAIDIIDRTSVIMEISKVIQNKEARDRIEECVSEPAKFVVAYNSNFDQRTRAGLPSCWDFQGHILPWVHYEQLLVEAKSKADSSHKNISTLKGRTIVNYLQRDFQLLWLVKTLFMAKPNYTKLTKLRMAYNALIHTPTPDPSYGKNVTSWLTHHKFE